MHKKSGVRISVVGLFLSVDVFVFAGYNTDRKRKKQKNGGNLYVLFGRNL